MRQVTILLSSHTNEKIVTLRTRSIDHQSIFTQRFLSSFRNVVSHEEHYLRNGESRRTMIAKE